MYVEANIVPFRQDLRAYLDQLAHDGKRVLILRHNREVGALVSVRDLNALESAEANGEMLMRARQQTSLEEYMALRAALRHE